MNPNDADRRPEPLRRLGGGSPMPTPRRHIDLDRVVIAGAGPTGLTAALTLAQSGVPVTVLEKGPALNDESRASTLHPPSLELLAGLGVVDAVLEQGLRAPRTQFRDRRSGPVATFDLSVLADSTTYPYRVQLEQNKIAEILRRRLLDGTSAGQWDADVRLEHRGHAVVSNDDAGVEFLVGTTDDYVSISCPWLIGADGAHSAVRSSLGIEMSGETYPEQFLVVSVADDLVDVMPDLEHVNYVADPDEWLVIIRTPDHWRLLFPIGPDERNSATEPTSVRARLDNAVQTSRDWSVLSTSLYEVKRSVAATMRDRGVLLAGDSAHQNSPLGGMGMNSGIQDAVSAARRLADVWHGRADDSVLDEYDRLRRTVATDFVQADSHANWLVLREPDDEARAAAQTELRAIAADPARHRERMARSAMLDSVRSHL